MTKTHPMLLTYRPKLGVSDTDISHILAQVPKYDVSDITNLDGGSAGSTYEGVGDSPIDGGSA